MDICKFLDCIEMDFFSGVPDSLLCPLCDELIHRYGIGSNHIVAANEGNAVALGAGYYLSTGQVPCVYLQNSGIGNIINPAASLLHEKVFGIPCLFIVGWRGEPGVPDEPQHVFQGEVTVRLLEDMNIEVFIMDDYTTEQDLMDLMKVFRQSFKNGHSAAIVMRKNALTRLTKENYENAYELTREEVIKVIAESANADDVFVSTTGMTSRELFELREAAGQSHDRDFLTVGSMGHNSSIALGIALQKPHRRVWCIDGDGAFLMHMGSLAIIGTQKPSNLVHVVINNGAHASVGGVPTAAFDIDIPAIARACGYENAFCVSTLEELEHSLSTVCGVYSLLTLIEVKTNLYARENLGRPTLSARQIKQVFMTKVKHNK